MQKGRIFIISAPSGCGKTTLVNKLLRARLGLARSVSVTTRRPRQGEKNKRDYYFVNRATFENMKKRGELLEWAKVAHHYYGTPARFVESNIKAKKDVLLNIDVQGATQVKKKYPDVTISIFLLPPSMAELNKRLKGRSTESAPEIKKRLAIAKKEISRARFYDYRVVNDNMDRALEEIKAIIVAK